MTVQRGEIWWADLDPIRGSEQAGVRPVLIFQNNAVSRFTTTVLAIPLTTNLRRALLPSCVRIMQGEGGLTSESVALCHSDARSGCRPAAEQAGSGQRSDTYRGGKVHPVHDGNIGAV